MEEDYVDHDEDGGLSYGQYVALNVLTMVSATASIMGSASILAIHIASHRKRKRRRGGGAANNGKDMGSYERLVVALSICDIGFSLLFFMQMFFIPSTKEYAYWAIGNVTSCNVLGFFAILLGTLVITYSSALSLYFLVSIKYGWPAQKVVAWVERPVHIWALGVALLLSVVGIATDQYDVLPLSQACYFSDYEYPAIVPSSTMLNSTATATDDTSSVEMITLTSKERVFIPTALNTLHVIYWLLLAVSGVIMTYRVYRHVKIHLNRTRHTRMSTRLVVGNGNGAEGTVTGINRAASSISVTAGSGDTNNMNMNSVPQVDAQIMNVSWQAIWYCVAYTNSFFWPFGRLMVYEITGGGSQGHPLHFAFAILHHLFYPMQGAFNFFIFIRPSVLQWRKYFPQQSTLWILRQIYSGEKAVVAAEAAGRRNPRRRPPEQNPNNDDNKDASRNFCLASSSAAGSSNAPSGTNALTTGEEGPHTKDNEITLGSSLP